MSAIKSGESQKTLQLITWTYSDSQLRKPHGHDEVKQTEKDNDKNTVIALREIAESTCTVEESKEKLIQEYQTVTIHDEEEENIEIENDFSIYFDNSCNYHNSLS